MPHQCTTCGNVFDDGSKEMLGGCPGCGGNTFQFHPEGTDVPADPPDADPPEPDGSTTANTVGRAATKVRDFVSRDSPDADAGAGATDEAGAGGSTPGEAGGATASASTDTAGNDGAAATPADDGPDPNRAWPGEEATDDPLASGGDDSDIIDADAREAARARQAAEDGAQTAARGELASDEELSTGSGPAEATTAGSTGSDGQSPEDGDASPSGSAGGGGLEAAENGAAAAGDAADAPGEGRVVSEPSEDEPDLSELREQLNDQFESIKILEPGQYELNLMELYDREEYIIALQENGRYVIQVPEQWLGDEPGA